MTLKKFIKYFEDMTELKIYDWNVSREPLFEGHTFDKGAKKKLKQLYKKGYKLERNDDGAAIMIFPYVNERGAKLAYAQVNVYLDNYKNL